MPIKMATLSLEIEQRNKRQERRDKLDLILELLIASAEPVKKTHLLYRTKINHAQLSRYLSFLLELGMMREISEPFEGFVVSEKGRVVAQLFTKIMNKP